MDYKIIKRNSDDIDDYTLTNNSNYSSPLFLKKWKFIYNNINQMSKNSETPNKKFLNKKREKTFKEDIPKETPVQEEDIEYIKSCSKNKLITWQEKKGKSIFSMKGELIKLKNEYVFKNESVLLRGMVKETNGNEKEVLIDIKEFKSLQQVKYIYSKYIKNEADEDGMKILKLLHQFQKQKYTKISKVYGATPVLKNLKGNLKWMHVEIDKLEKRYLIPKNVVGAQINNKRNEYMNFIKFNFSIHGKKEQIEIFTFSELQNGLKENQFKELINFCNSEKSPIYYNSDTNGIVERIKLKSHKTEIEIRKELKSYIAKCKRSSNNCLLKSLALLDEEFNTSIFKKKYQALGSMPIITIIETLNNFLKLKLKSETGFQKEICYMHYKEKSLNDCIISSPPNSILLFQIPNLDIGHSIYLDSNNKYDNNDIFIKLMKNYKKSKLTITCLTMNFNH